jgi:uncharacterized protein YcsI (UPF0317 family)
VIEGVLLTGAEARLAIRDGLLTGSTSGIAPGYVQVNLAILPAGLAVDFRRYCELNPKPCPLLAVSQPGAVTLSSLGRDIDIRTDAPAYRVYRDGRLDAEVSDLTGVWRDDLVTFALGCSFSFEWALLEAGLSLRHQEQGLTVPMYRTTIATTPSGPFRGPLVVTMRPFQPDDAERAADISARYPSVHGGPVHVGDPAAIGIADLAHPDWGDAVEIRPGEVPVFWACGVTPQAAAIEARLPFCLTHAPGSLLITDLLNRDLAEA